MTDVVPHTTNPLPVLATPGERYGWIFRDRNLFRRRFTEPPPTPGVVPADLAQRVAAARQRLPKRILVSLGIGFGFAMILGCCGGLASSGSEGGGAVFGVLAFMSMAAGVGGAILAWVAVQSAKNALQSRQEEVQHEHHHAHAAWKHRQAHFEQGQQQAVDAMLEWGAATPAESTRRVDIVGGTMWGWEALLTIFGGSLLGTRGAMTVVDFTGEALCGELIGLAQQTNRSVRVTTLPSQLPELDLVSGLAARELVDCLVEAMYGDSQGAATRAERHQDTMLLTEVGEALDGHLSMARLTAALRVLGDHPHQPALTALETESLMALHPDETRRQMQGSLRRIEAFLRPLAVMGTTAVASSPADLTCLIADTDGRNAQSELLKDLIVQWLIRQVGQDRVRLGSLVLVGADEVGHRHIERLTALCERRGIRLVLLYSHLREESLQTIGGGEVGFMRLGNHHEAQQAAEFIGRQHKFVLSQLTRTLGGNDTHTIADTVGESVSDGTSSGSSSGGGHFSRQSGSSWTHTRNWSQTESVARGTNWSDAATAQRVYEFAVEPRVMQDLPDYALLLVKREGRGSVVQAVECNPALVTLPRFTMDPLPYVPLPDPAEAVVPASREPSEVTVSQPAPLTAPGPTAAQDIAATNLPGWGAPAPGAYQQQPYQPQEPWRQ